MPELLVHAAAVGETIDRMAGRYRLARFETKSRTAYRVPCVNATAFEAEVAARLLEAHPTVPFVATWREHDSQYTARCYRLWPRRKVPRGLAEAYEASEDPSGSGVFAFTTTYLL